MDNMEVWCTFEYWCHNKEDWGEVDVRVDCTVTHGSPRTWDDPGEPAGCMPWRYRVQNFAGIWVPVEELAPTVGDWSFHMGFIEALESGCFEDQCDQEYDAQFNDVPEYDHDEWREMYHDD
jgi:hypothetical protein